MKQTCGIYATNQMVHTEQVGSFKVSSMKLELNTVEWVRIGTDDLELRDEEMQCELVHESEIHRIRDWVIGRIPDADHIAISYHHNGILRVNFYDTVNCVRVVTFSDSKEFSGSWLRDTFEQKGEIVMNDVMDKIVMKNKIVMKKQKSTILSAFDIFTGIPAEDKDAESCITSTKWRFQFTIWGDRQGEDHDTYIRRKILVTEKPILSPFKLSGDTHVLIIYQVNRRFQASIYKIVTDERDERFSQVQLMAVTDDLLHMQLQDIVNHVGGTGFGYDADGETGLRVIHGANANAIDIDITPDRKVLSARKEKRDDTI